MVIQSQVRGHHQFSKGSSQTTLYNADARGIKNTIILPSWCGSVVKQ